MAARRRIALDALPLLLGLWIATGGAMSSLLGNEDLWWYLASGDEILARGEVPDRDPFLFTSEARDTWVTSSREQPTWVQHSWLWTVALAAVHRGFGTDGLAALSALAVGGFATLLFAQRRFDRCGLVNAAIASAVLLACIDRLALRAELSGWLLFAVFAVLLDAERPWSWRRFALLAALQWLWSNLHGSYVLGLGLAVAYAIDGAWRRRADPTAPAVPLWVPAALCVVSVATPGLGPARIGEAVAVAQQLVSAAAGSYAAPIEEWQSTFAGGFGPDAWRHLAIAALGLAGFAAARRVRPGRALVFVGMGALAASALRFVGGFAIATGLVTAWNLSERRRPSGARSEPQAGEAHGAGRGIALQRAFAGALAVALAAVGVARIASRGELDVGQSGAAFATLHPQFTCPGAAAYIRDAQLADPIFNDVALGGYLIWALYPEHRLFIDTRNLSAAVVEDYRGALRDPERWRTLERRWGFRTVVLGNARVPNLPLRKALAADPDWQLVYFDPQASVFARRGPGESQPRFEPWGRARGVPYLPSSGERWLTGQGAPLLARYLDALLEIGRPADAAALASAALELQPTARYWLQVRALGRLQSDDPAGAAADFGRLVARMPRNPEARYRHAVALHRAGDDAAALAELDALAALQPGHEAARALRHQIGSR